MRTGGLLPAVALVALLATLAPVSGQISPAFCSLPPEVGPCRARIPRYFYNPRSRKCEKFYYGGCEGNQNNFKTLKECQHTCIGKPGTCPRAPPGTVTTCDVRCSSDWGCPGRQKCCRYACQIACHEPV